MIEDPKRPRSLSLDAAERKTVRDAAAAAASRSRNTCSTWSRRTTRTATRWC